MKQPLNLPSLNPVPDDINEQLRHLLQTDPKNPALEPWLLELIKNSGHLSTGHDMRWRVLSTIWLAQFDVDKAWPYLMWLNMNEPVIGDHLSEILVEAADELNAYLPLVNWIVHATDARMVTFFDDFRPTPPASKVPALLGQLLARPAAPETGTWLATFYQTGAGQSLPHLRQWRLLAAAWYATQFDQAEGLAYLQQFTDGNDTLSEADIALLMEAAEQINGVQTIRQWIAACSDPAITTMLQEFGHPDLAAFVREALEGPPDYARLPASGDQARTDAQAFQRYLTLLGEADVSLKNAKILDLACGLLAPQTVLFNAAGYRTTGVDLHIPPAYLPLPGLRSWFKRNKHKRAWQEATAPYYQALGRHSGLPLKWNRVKIELADLTRLQFPDNSFNIVICVDYLQHAPDVAGLLAEASRVLAPNGILLATIIPYPAFSGGFQPAGAQPAWAHLKNNPPPGGVPLNQWREAQYRAALEQQLSITHWLTDQDEAAQAQLTPEIRTELADYSPEELTRRHVIVIAQKASHIH